MKKQRHLLSRFLTKNKPPRVTYTLAATASLTAWLLLSACGNLMAAPNSAAEPPIRRYQLPSGQSVYVLENHSRPIVTMDTWVPTGSVNETLDNNGVSHFLEHLLFKGTPDYPPGTIDRLLDSKGAEFNAATSLDFTHYYITVASPFFEDALKLHASMLQQANIPADELDKERLVVQEEINRAEGRPEAKLFKALNAALFAGHPYALTTLGPKSLIGTLPRQAILDYYHAWYQPKNFKTVVVGDVDPAKTVDLIDRYFTAAQFPPPKNYVAPKVGKPDFTAQPSVTLIEDANMSQGYAIWALPAPDISLRDDSVALDAAFHILGGDESSRLYQRLHNENNWVQSISSGNMTQRYGGVLYIMAELEPGNLQKTQTVVLEELNRLAKNGVNPQELDDTVRQFTKDFLFLRESTAGVANAMGYNVTIGTLDDYTRYLERLRTLTPAEVQAALNRWLLANRLTMVGLLPAPKEEASNAAAASSTVTLSQTLLTELQNQSAKGFIAGSAQEEAEKPAKLERMTLANGLTLMLNPLPQAQTVSLQLFVKGGQAAERRAGLAQLFAQVWPKATVSRPEALLQKTLSAQGLAIEASSHENYLELSANAASDDLGELLLILKDVLEAPALEAALVEREKSQLLATLESNQDTPLNLAKERYMQTLFAGHPYGQVGDRMKGSIQGLTARDLRTYYRHWVRPENVVISVAGRFDARQLQRELATWQLPSSTLPTSGNPVASNPVLTPPTTSLTLPIPVIKSNQAVQTLQATQAASWILQGWPVPGINHPDYAALKVLSALLGEGMSSRLFVALREKQGLAYLVGSNYPSLAGASSFTCFIGTDPANQEAVLAGFNEQITRLLKEDMTEDELERAKNFVLGRFELNHETPSEMAFYPGFFEAVGVGAAFDEGFTKAIAQVHLEDLNRVARTYLSQPYVISVVGPKPLAGAVTPPPAPVSVTETTPPSTPEENPTPDNASSTETSTVEPALSSPAASTPQNGWLWQLLEGKKASPAS